MPQLFWPSLPSQSLLWPMYHCAAVLCVCQQASGPVPITPPFSYCGASRGGLLIPFVTTNSEPSGQQFGKLYTHLKCQLHQRFCFWTFQKGTCRLMAIVEEPGFLTTFCRRGSSGTPDICQRFPPTEEGELKSHSYKCTQGAGVETLVQVVNTEGANSKLLKNKNLKLLSL